MEDWGLQAVVRGSSGDFTNIVNTDHIMDQNSFLGFSSHQKFDYDQFVFEFPEIFGSVNVSGDELEELYKSFCANPAPAQTVFEFKEGSPPESALIQEKQAQDYPSDQTSDSTTSRATACKPKYKRRKNEHKKVVQVSAEDLSSDVWAWRKYGQKPIKGSPYPRSYYRCSSSKGCLARKQVEQSCTDPGMFIMTYTADHNHSQPTRRNSLAGTIRQKFPAPRSPNRSKTKQERTEDSISCSKMSAPFLSTETLLPSPLQEDFLQAKCNQEGKLEDDELIFSDDFFSGLEEFGGFNSEIFSVSCHSTSAQQFSVSSCSL